MLFVPTSDPAYLSIVQWNDAADEFACIESLVASAAMDPDQARLAVRRGVPQVVMQIDPAVRDDVLGVLRDRGDLAFAPTRSELKHFGRPQLIKSLSRMDAGSWYGCEMWRTDPTSFKSRDVFLIIRGRLKITKSRTLPRAPRYSAGGPGIGGFGGYGDMVPDDPITPAKATSVTMAEVMDLYTRDGARLRLDGDKLSFSVLGDSLGLSDNQNMSTLLDMLKQDCPGALVDERFRDFRCPPAIARRVARVVGGESFETASDRPVFDFYSPWTFLLYRSVTGG